MVERKKTRVPANVLADRYATPEMIAIWEPENGIVLSRQLWVAAMKAMRDLGRDIPKHAIEAYEAVTHIVDRDSIRERERALRHSEKAEIEEFNERASAMLGERLEHAHAGFTSRDKTDNVEQAQIIASLKLVRVRHVAMLTYMRKQMHLFKRLEICGRSHLVPGQVITLGKRLANWAQEALLAHEQLEHVLATYPLRGIKGPMGTQQDMTDLLGHEELALRFEERIRDHLGFKRVLTSTGQVYPRSLDHWVLTTLARLAAAPANFAKMVRLMAGLELMHEGFKKGQTGSSAMPHKINSRTCERICGLYNILQGYVDMISRVMGDQWLEGDVSCSVVRRVALPDAFFALDAIFECTMTVLQEMEVFKGMVETELSRYKPFLSTTAILMNALKRNIGRETAHRAIKSAAVAAVRAMREGKPNHFVRYLCSESHLFPEDEVLRITASTDPGLSTLQVEEIIDQIHGLVDAVPEARGYEPLPIL